MSNLNCKNQSISPSQKLGPHAKVPHDGSNNSSGLVLRARSIPVKTTAAYTSSAANDLTTEAISAHLYGGSPADRIFLKTLNIDELQKGEFLKTFFTRAGWLDDQVEIPENVVEIGCGDGFISRMMHRLRPDGSVCGLESDISKLTVARREGWKLLKATGQAEPWDKDVTVEVNWSTQPALRFHYFNIHDQENFSPSHHPVTFPLPPDAKHVVKERGVIDHMGHSFRAAVSTLFLQKVTLEAFFNAVDNLLYQRTPPGWDDLGVHLLITNMHDEMAQKLRIDQARPRRYIHSMAAVIEEAENRGYRMVEQRTRTVTEDDVKRYGQGCKKWVGVQCWYAIVFQRVEEWKGSGPPPMRLV